MVDQSESTANTWHLTDTVRFRSLTKAINPQEFKRLYVDHALSTTQVAEQLGYSRSFVITTLKRLKLIRPKKGAQTNPENYRLKTPPYGYRVTAQSKLEIAPVELKVCRLIVQLIDEREMNFLKTGQELERRGIKNRRGKVRWHNYTVQKIYERWRGKL